VTDYDSDNPMADVPDWALRPTALYGASGTVWVRSDPSSSGLIGWYPDGVGVAKPWRVVEQDGPRKPEICSSCWFSDCKNCSKRAGVDLPCDHLRIGHRLEDAA
jgi:hypothetical protein